MGCSSINWSGMYALHNNGRHEGSRVEWCASGVCSKPLFFTIDFYWRILSKTHLFFTSQIIFFIKFVIVVGEPDVCSDCGGVGKGHCGRRRHWRNVEDQPGGPAYRVFYVSTAFVNSHLRLRDIGSLAFILLQISESLIQSS